MEIVNHTAEQYAKQFTTAETGVLSRVNTDTVATHALAHMLSGHVQGTLLQMLSSMIQPLRILEVGTFTGYSAICLTKGLRPGGKLHTIELREEDAAKAAVAFKEAGLDEIIQLHIGNAADIIPQLDEAWDLVFIDADKPGYIDYYRLILPKLKSGGYIIADNVLFHGEVLEEPLKGKNAIAIDAFNRYVAADESVEQVMLTVRDGLMIIKKL
jgi:predicted O-methyltransferase YrrM